MFPLRAKIADPSTYGINRFGKNGPPVYTSGGAAEVIDDGRDDNEQNQRDVGGTTAVAAAAGVGVLGLAGAAAAAGMSKSGLKKVAAVEKTSTKSIAAIDSKAVKDISEVYKENGMTMPQPVATDTQVGVMTVPLAVTGAAAAASAANMNPADVARVAAIENAAKGEIATVDEAAGDQLETIHAKEGIGFTRPTGAAAAAGIVGAGAIGAVVAGGLSKASQVKAGTVKQSAEAQIALVDANAVSNVASIYGENNMTMETPTPTSTQVGVTTASLGIVGAGALAAKTKMGSLDIARIMKVEKEATGEIKSIDNQAAEEIAAIHEKEGVWFDRPAGSRAAAAAAAAGLGFQGVKKIAATEEGAEREIDLIDNTAASEITAATKVHATHMRKCAKSQMTMALWDAEEEASAAKFSTIGETAADKIDSVDRSTEEQVAAIYTENGMTLEKGDGERDYFTARGATGATATAAAIAAAAKLAVQRKENLGTVSRSAATTTQTTTTLTGEDGLLHLGIYDLGAGVAAVGKAITGQDFEGPSEYDARAHWTPERRAMSCCS